jgi:hypothetical protein
MADTYLLVVIGCRKSEEFSLDFLKHFLSHYISCGIYPHQICVSLLEDGSVPEVRSYLQNIGVTITRDLSSSRYDPFQVTSERQALQKTLPTEAWIINPDMDELIAFTKPVHELVSDMEKARYDSLSGWLWDRFDSNFLLKPVHPSHPLHLQFPVAVEFTAKVLLANPKKEVLTRNWYRIGQGGHFLESLDSRQISPAPSSWHLRIDHYKWTAGLKMKTERLNQLSLAEPQRYPWRHEYDRLLKSIYPGPDGDYIIRKTPIMSETNLPWPEAGHL